MKLANAAKFFDRLVCQDAYGTSMFNGQMNLYDDATRDGLGSVRRILSTAPDVTIPTRHVISADGDQWLVGDDHPDFFGNGVIRRKYIVHRADALAAVRSFGEFLSGAAGHAAYAARVWIKSAKQVEVSSDLFNVYDLLFSADEQVGNGSIVTIGNDHYLAFTSYSTEGGFKSVRAMELTDLLHNGNVINRVYSPVADSYATTSRSAKVLKIRWQDHFDYFAQYAPHYVAGDVQLITTQAEGDVSVGDLIALSGQDFRAVDVLADNGVWSIHGRPQ